MRKIILLVITLYTLSINSQINNGDNNIYKTDTIKSKNVKIIAIPIVFTTPETGFGIGGGAQFFLLNKSNIYNSRLSNILVSAIYTFNQQIMIDVNPKIYLKNGDYFLDASYKLEIFPNSFWGIGSNTKEENVESYNMTSNSLNISLLKRLPPNLNFGFQFTYQNHNVTERQLGGELEKLIIPGSEGATIVGLGSVFNFDNRDNVADPKKGHFLGLSAQFSSKNFGATHNFNKFITDLRAYMPINENSTLATQIYLETNYGDVPFQSKALYGGSNRARGYFRGRFIDNHSYVVQAEYRWRFHPRWGLAFFGLIGEVADQPKNFLSNLKPSFGGGIRFKITKNQNTLLRLGMAKGKDDNGGLYFGVNQAF